MFYTVSNRYKNRFCEEYRFTRGEETLAITVTWREGSLAVKLTPAELTVLENADSDFVFNSDEYEESYMQHTWDGVDTEVTCSSGNEQSILEGWLANSYEYLEQQGWDEEDITTYIYGELEIEPCEEGIYD